MSNVINPTIFESLNARQLTPEQIAETFVPTKKFSELLKRNHNIIIGPRGSGKTTLLKMLQLPALNKWEHEDAADRLRNLDFVSAFIPTDISWKEQWSLIDELKLNDELELNDQKRDLLKNSVFSTHTLKTIIAAFRFRMKDDLLSNDYLKKFHIELDRNQESNIANDIAESIKLELRIPSLEFVEFQLRNRLVRIGEYVNKVRAGSKTPEELEFIYLNFFDLIKNLISILNKASGNEQQKWALLFDELELAPKEIRTKLISNTRSTDGRILFKLSISPYSEGFDMLTDATSPSAGHDYIPINLWYPYKENARPFCNSLFDQIAKSLGLGDVSPEQVFDTSEFALGNFTRKNGESAYKKGSLIYHRFRKLKDKDPTFATYLSRKKININAMGQMPENKKASIVRKITNIVSVREVWRRNDGKLSSKRKPSLYTGATTLFDITEGNPRLFISIVGALLKEYKNDRKTIESSRQSDAIAQESNRFRALLSTIPIQKGNGVEDINGLNDLLDTIGKYFREKTVVEDFTADPPTCFIVDSKTPNGISKALSRALNAGAIVYIPDNPGNPLLKDLTDRRFRLTYLLAPHYKLPIMVSKSKSHVLSKILGETESQLKPDLFNEPGV